MTTTAVDPTQIVTQKLKGRMRSFRTECYRAQPHHETSHRVVCRMDLDVWDTEFVSIEDGLPVKIIPDWRSTQHSLPVTATASSDGRVTPPTPAYGV